MPLPISVITGLVLSDTTTFLVISLALLPAVSTALYVTV